MPFQLFRSVYEVFEERERVRKLKISLIAGTFFVCYCVLVIFVLKNQETEMEERVSAQAVVPASSPAPTANKVTLPTIRATSLTRRSIVPHVPVVPSTPYYEGSGFSMKVHLTSSASPLSIGGGGNGGGTMNNGRGSSSRASSLGGNTSYPMLSYVPIMQSTSAIVETPQQRLQKHNLTADNRLASMQGVIESSGPNTVYARAKKGGWDDYGQDEEPFLDPVGDVTWELMALLAAVYVAYVYRRKRVKKLPFILSE